MGQALPGRRLDLGERLERFIPVPGVPAGAPQDHLHHERDRVAQLPATEESTRTEAPSPPTTRRSSCSGLRFPDIEDKRACAYAKEKGLPASRTARSDVLFELADAVLCADGPVKTLVDLTLVTEHRRGHKAMYDLLNHAVLRQSGSAGRWHPLPLPRGPRTVRSCSPSTSARGCARTHPPARSGWDISRKETA